VVVKATKGKTVWVVAQLKKIFLNQNDVLKGFGEHNSLMLTVLILIKLISSIIYNMS
jgi:hypothetical protein